LLKNLEIDALLCLEGRWFWLCVRLFEPLHYLALIEQKINALDQAAPLAGWRLPEEFATLRRLLEARIFAMDSSATGHE
jgi:hypothetical protein